MAEDQVLCDSVEASQKGGTSDEGMKGPCSPGMSTQEAPTSCPGQETPRQPAEPGGANLQHQHAAEFNRTMAVGIISWMTPLAWLERTLPESPVVAGLQRSLLFPATQQDKSTSISPISVVSTATWMSLSRQEGAGQSHLLEDKDSHLHPEGARDPGTPPVSGAVGSPLCSTAHPAGKPGPSKQERTPIQQQEKQTMVTPVSLASALTWTSPPDLLDTGVNTSLGENPSIKDSTTETDSLLWHCSRDQLSNLSRAELEGRLESTLIIMEALSRQIRVCHELRQPDSHVGPADLRDAGTQTPIREPKAEERVYHDMYAVLRQRYEALLKVPASERALMGLLATAVDELKTWSVDSRLLQEQVDASYLHLQKDRKALGHQQQEMRNLLSRFREKLQRWKQKELEMEKAIRAKDAADQVLDSLRTHADNRITQMAQSRETQKDLHALLKEAKGLQAALCAGYASSAEGGNRLADILRENWVQMRRDYKVWKDVAVRYRAAMQRMKGEVDTSRRELAEHQQICQNLEESKVELLTALARVNELMVENAQQHRDLKDSLQKLSYAETKERQLQEDNEILSRQLMEKQEAVQELEEAKERLSLEKAKATQERDNAQQEARDASDCKEFLEQENRISRQQLAETEAALKSTLSTLRERSAQLEDLKDAHRELQQEQDSLRQELAGVRAKLQSARDSLDTFSRGLLDIESIRAQFLEVVSFLRGTLKGEPLDAPKSRACTPARQRQPSLGASFVNSVLQAVAERDVKNPGIWSESTAFTKTTPSVPPTPAESEEHLAACTWELWKVAEELRLLTAQQQKTAQEQGLGQQAEIARLKQQLEDQEGHWKAEVEARDVSLARLSRTLQLERQTGKELQEILKDQDRELHLMSNKAWETTYLQEEVAQLKHALQKSETESATLWEELRGEKPSDAERAQERVWLRQEAGKLRELFLQEKKENIELQAKYQSTLASLEEDLHHTQQALKYQRKAEAEMVEIFSRLPAEVAEMPEIKHILAILS